MKRFLGLTICILLILSPFVSCDDYIETGIEGQWQLHKKVDQAGDEYIVDTVFYAFKKNVFRYLKLQSSNDGDVFTCYGNYRKEGAKIIVDSIERESFRPWDCSECFDWDSYYKEFSIKKHKGGQLELVSDGVLYVFKKY